MDDLIKALQILRKYGNPKFPTHCEHDIMHVNIEYNKVSNDDKVILAALGFDEDDFGMFSSYRFGSS